MFGINRFHTYLFGKAFIVETDHKPLEMIWKEATKVCPTAPSEAAYQDPGLQLRRAVQARKTHGVCQTP